MMTPLDDDLLTALRAARPDPDYQPSATSPEARAMLARIVQARHGAPRLARRWRRPAAPGRPPAGRPATHRRWGAWIASRWLAPVAAMVAVASIAGVTVAVQEAGRAPASAGHPGAGRPDIYVTVTARWMEPLASSGSVPSRRPGLPRVSTDFTVGTATIRDASTGAALTSVQLWPRQPEHPRGPAFDGWPGGPEIAAAADDRTFAIDEQNVTTQGGFYLLHVSASGRAARLVRLSVTIPGEQGVPPDFDLSPDAAKLAVHVLVCPNSKWCADGIAIITLATGTVRTWPESSPDEQVMSPSWTDNGTAVMFQWSSPHGAVWGQRVLSDAAPQGNLDAESEQLRYPPASPQRFPNQWVGTPAVLTRDGRSALVVTQSIVPAPGNSGTIIFRITDEDPATGRVLRVLRVFQTHYKGNPALSKTACNIVSLGPAGLHALLECPQFGRLDGSTFTPLPTGPPGSPDQPTVTAAW